MKINSLHFENSEKSLINAIQDSSAINICDYNFGLIENASGQKESLVISVVKSIADNFIVKLTCCRAITYGGMRIEIIPELVSELSLSTQVNISNLKSGVRTFFYLIVSVDYDERVASGDPDPKEDPPRFPYVHPRYSLSMMDSNTIDITETHANTLVIGRFNLNGNDLVWDKEYIPASLNMQCFPLLRQYYNSISEDINTIQVSVYNIIYKQINQKQNSPLAFNIKIVCEKIIFYISSLFFPFRFVLYQRSPIETVYSIVQLANHLKLAIDLLPEKEKEDLLLYFKEWSNIAPGKFDEILSSIIEIDYNHQDVAASFEPISVFTSLIADLFKKLSELDLIGKKRGDKDMFVREINQKQNKKFKIID